MKNKILLLAAALAAVLVGCGARTAAEPTQSADTTTPEVTPLVSHRPTATPEREETAPPERTPAPAPESVHPADPEPTLTVEPTLEPEEPAFSRPDDEAVLAAYREASEAYGWFAGYTDVGLALDGEDVEVRTELTFYRVTRPGLDSLDSLRGYLKSLFSDEIVDGLLGVDPGTPHFVEGEQGLYALPAGRGADINKGGVTLAVLWPEGAEPGACTVQATVDLLEWDASMLTSTVVGQRVYDFPYQKVGEKWVFTRFESIF